MKSGRRDATVLAGSGQTDKRSALIVREQTDRRSMLFNRQTNRRSMLFNKQTNRRSVLLMLVNGYIGGMSVFIVVERQTGGHY